MQSMARLGLCSGAAISAIFVTTDAYGHALVTLLTEVVGEGLGRGGRAEFSGAVFGSGRSAGEISLGWLGDAIEACVQLVYLLMQ